MNDSFFVGDWQVIPQQNLLQRNGSTIRIEPKVMSLLVFLAENAGEVVPKSKLLEVVWEDAFVTEQVLKVAVSELRKALDDDAKVPRYIQTISKKGYQLIANVKPLEINPAPDQVSIPSESKLTHRARFIGVAGLISLCALLLWYLSGEFRQTTNRRTFQSIAILPLQDISEDRSQTFFADGLTEAIASRLARGDLIVISPRATLTYKNSKKKASQIAKELNVDALVDGKVVRAGGKVRLDVSLIDGKTEKLIWSESYENQMKDILGLQSRLSSDIAGQINLTLLPQNLRAAVNPDAYEEFLKGRFFWSKRNPETMKKSLEFYNRAVQQEPDNGLYFSGIADSYILLAFYSSNGSSGYYSKAKEAALKALERDNSLAEAHTSLAAVLHKYDLDWQGAEREFQTAIRLNPNYPTAHQWYAIYLMSKGEHQKALYEIDKALELDPLSLVMRTDRGWLLYVAGRYDEAIDQLNSVNELEANAATSFFLILTYCKKRMYDEAMIETRRAIETFGRSATFDSLITYIQALSGNKNDALKELEEIKKSYGENISPFQLAIVSLALGNKDEAVNYLETLTESRSSWQPFLGNEPALEDLRSNPRFQSLLARTNSPISNQNLSN